MRQVFAISFLCLLVGGCSLFGSSYEKPKVNLPSNWDQGHDANYVESGANLSDISWWKRFNDKELDHLIDLALDNNNSIEIAIGNIALAKAQLEGVHMSWIPSINLGGAIGAGEIGDFSFSPDGQLGLPPLGMPNDIKYNFYQGGLIPSYTLNIIQQFKKGDIAKANLAKARALKDSVRLAIISQVSGSYFTLLALNQQLHTQKEMVNDLTSLIKSLKIQLKYGYLTQVDIDPYQQNLDRAKMSVPQIEANITKLQNALRVLTDNNIDFTSWHDSFESLPLDGVIAINMPSTVLNNRPDIIEAEQRIVMANGNISFAKASFFPTFNLTTPLGGFNSNVTNLFGASGNFWQAQIAANMPILNLQLSALIKQAKAGYYIAYYNYVQVVKQAFAEVNDNISGYSKSKQSLQATSDIYHSAKSNYHANQLRYKLGYISYPDSLQSKVNLEKANISLTQSKLSELQSLIELYQSLAGGYNYHNREILKTFGDGHDI